MNNRRLVWVAFLIGSSFFITVQSCEKATLSNFVQAVPAHFPTPDFPTDNQPTPERIELGRRLFHEKALSSDSSISCASCHLQQLAFSDGQKVSLGVNNSLGVRNAPALINLAYDKFFFRDGGVTRLETQAMSPILNPKEMNFTIEGASKRLALNPVYENLSQKAYGRAMSPFVITRALAAFQRNLISGNSRFDAYFYERKKKVFNASEKRGLALFFSKKTQCSNCHHGFNFTNFSFENNGLYAEYTDRGREKISLNPEDNGKFKVPTLRNVALTAPYMHDGSLPTLTDVILHYNEGGKGHRNQSKFIKPLQLSEQEQTDLVNFLHTLTDKNFIQNPDFQPSF